MNLIRSGMSREGFMIAFFGLVGTVGGALITIPIIGEVIGPLIKPGDAKHWVDLGDVTGFKEGETVMVKFPYPKTGYSSWSGVTNSTGAWLRRDSTNQFTAFAIYCTHLGCPVRWYQKPQLFLCPCHGSVFNGDGTVAGGPAPRPLFNYPTRVVNGRVQIQTEKVPVVNPIGGVGFGE